MRSPFTGLRFARLELDNFRAGTMIKLALCAIALIPLIYAGLFLLAFLDPYGSLVNVPAVIVNEDEGDKINGEQRNVGQELCDELVKNNENRKEGEASGYNWRFVNDPDGARRGLDDGTYYMELVIPKNFSKAVASADTKNPENAELQAYFNPSTNLIAQTVGSSMVTKIRAELNYKVGKEYYDNIFLKIDDAADQIQEAVDGTDKLDSGLGELEDGSGTLTDGLETAKSGSDSLESGLGQLQTGSGTLTDGLESAKDGSDQLASGSEKLQNGSKTLGKGIDSATSGAKKLEKGAKSAKSGSDQLESGAKSLSDGASQVDKGVDTLSSSLKQLQDGIATAQSSTATLSQAIQGVADALTAYQSTGETSYLTTATQLAAQVKQANSTIGDDLYTYVASLTSKLSAYQTAASEAAEKQAAMEKAQKALEEPAADLQKSASQLQGDLKSLGSAGTQTEQEVQQLQDSLAQLNKSVQSGSIEPAEALSTINGALGGLDLGSLSAAIQAVVSSTTSGSGPETLIHLQKFQTALTAYQSAASEYQTAATAEATAGADAKEARGQITGYLTGVKNASTVASGSTDTVSSAIDQLYTAVSGDLKSGTSQLASGAEALATGTVSLGNGIQAIQTGEHSLVVGLGKLQNGNGTITKSLGTAGKGAKSLSNGLASAVSGSDKITTNLGTAKEGAGSLSDGLASAVSGSEKITKGLGTAKSGSEKLHDGLKDGKTQLEKNIQNKKQKAEMMSEPVTANGSSQTGESITQVKNYGTGFAPYFISLGMWVGALMISMVMNVLNRRILMSGASSISAVLASYFPMLLVSFAQVVLLLLVIQFGLHMEVKYPAAFYLFGLLTSVCFVAIIQFFRASMGTTGMVVIVVLLMLQLCTAAGTFPIEAELPVFNVLNPYLPMTYVVHGFRMCMAGLSLSYMGRDVAVLLLFSAAFLFFTLLWARHRRTVTMSQLYPPLKLSD